MDREALARLMFDALKAQTQANGGYISSSNWTDDGGSDDDMSHVTLDGHYDLLTFADTILAAVK